MHKIIKNIINFFSLPDEVTQAEPKKPQVKIKAAEEKTYTYKDLEFRHDNYSDMIYAHMEFNNGYHMYVSVKDFTKDAEYQEYLKHESPSGYEISIVDSNGRKNSTCLNKDGKNLIAYNKNAVTTLMKQIQRLDEKGQLSAEHNATIIEARKKHIKKIQKRRQADKNNHPEDAVSGHKVADEIAAKIISGKEKRVITPSVALEYRKKLSRNQ